MVWIIVAAVVLLLVYSAGFRTVALGLLAFVIVVGIIVYVYEEIESQRSRTRILPQDLELNDLRLTTSGSYSRQLTGRIKNNSDQYTLRSLDLKITFRDCENELKESCTIVGEATEHINVRIPPKQARDINERVSGLGTIAPKGKIVLSYGVTELRGE